MSLRENRGMARGQQGRVSLGQKTYRRLRIGFAVRDGGRMLNILSIPDLPTGDERDGAKGQN